MLAAGKRRRDAGDTGYLRRARANISDPHVNIVSRDGWMHKIAKQLDPVGVLQVHAVDAG